MRTLQFDGTKIALIVRGKRDHAHEPRMFEQHADVILADGSPMGFFGHKQPHVSGWSDRSATTGLVKSTTLKTGLNNKGVVFDYQGFRIARPWYVDAAMAKQKVGVVSCVLVINVSESEAALFKGYWITLKSNPGLFNLVGYNFLEH